MDPESDHINAIFRWFGPNFATIKTKMQEKMQKIALPCIKVEKPPKMRYNSRIETREAIQWI